MTQAALGDMCEQVDRRREERYTLNVLIAAKSLHLMWVYLLHVSS